MNHRPEPEPANVLTSAELKRRGMAAIELGLEWLLLQSPATQPRSKPAIDAELAAEREW
jgi:hypothetical protein